MKEFENAFVTLKEVTFEYTSLFGKRKCKTVKSLKNCPLSKTVRGIVSKENERNELERLKENQLYIFKSYLSPKYKDVKIINADYVIELTNIKDLSAEWCLRNLTLKELVRIGVLKEKA